MAWPKKGRPLLRLVSGDYVFLKDRELVRLAVKAHYSELQYASPTLRADHDFLLSLIAIDVRTLVYAAHTVRYDYDILVAAIANNTWTIFLCFSGYSDFNFLVSFASKVRRKLELHDVFVREILRGIAIAKPHEAPAHRCHLPLLDRGSETSTVLKKLIAEFLGAPLGKELHVLRKVSLSLMKSGY